MSKINSEEIELLPNLREAEQYPIDRDIFCNIFEWMCEVIYDLSDYNGADFKVWRDDDEFYLMHKDSLTVINWYKHLGRTNTCNKVLTKEEYLQFSDLLKEELKQGGRYK